MRPLRPVSISPRSATPRASIGSFVTNRERARTILRERIAGPRRRCGWIRLCREIRRYRDSKVTAGGGSHTVSDNLGGASPESIYLFVPGVLCVSEEDGPSMPCSDTIGASTCRDFKVLDPDGEADGLWQPVEGMLTVQRTAGTKCPLGEELSRPVSPKPLQGTAMVDLMKPRHFFRQGCFFVCIHIKSGKCRAMCL